MWRFKHLLKASFLFVFFGAIVYSVFIVYERNVLNGIRKAVNLNEIYKLNNSLILNNEHLPTQAATFHRYPNDTPTESTEKIVTTKAFVEPQEFSTNPNLTVLNTNFYQYLISQLRNTVYPGVDNYTEYTVVQNKLKPLPGVQPLRPEFGPVLNNVASFRYPIDIKPCKEIEVNSSSLFVAIISAAGNFERREMIRQTWLHHFMSIQNESHLLAGHGFIIGLTADNKVQMQIEEESKKYGDILQIDFMDNYYNLTIKVVGLINWLHKNCSNVNFVFKVDDDTYVNARNVFALTKYLNATEKSLYGYHSNSISAQRGSQVRKLYLK